MLPEPLAPRTRTATEVAFLAMPIVQRYGQEKKWIHINQATAFRSFTPKQTQTLSLYRSSHILRTVSLAHYSARNVSAMAMGIVLRAWVVDGIIAPHCTSLKVVVL